MCRDEFPRIFELRDSLPTPLPEGVAFPALDQTIIEYPQKRKFLGDIEVELQGSLGGSQGQAHAIAEEAQKARLAAAIRYVE